MDGSEESKLKPTKTRASKRSKVAERAVVTMKIGGNEGPPSDSWSWRKYEQKPIKGPPYPRGYYKCSTSKGCSAKKQVEICKTDASMLIITYTSSHNHLGLDLDTKNRTRSPPKELETNDDHPTVSHAETEASEEEHFHYLQSPLIQQAERGASRTVTFCSKILQQLYYILVQCHALVLAPTWELLQQIVKLMQALGEYLDVKVHARVGGTNMLSSVLLVLLLACSAGIFFVLIILRCLCWMKPMKSSLEV